MNRLVKQIWLLMLVIMVNITPAGAQITVSVPSHVSMGENFRLAYSINTQDVESFREGKIPAGLELIAGPYTSRQSSYQIVNGHTSSSSSITFTYTLYADKNGTYTIPAAHAVINGRSVASRPVKVTVSGHARNTSNRPQMHEDRQQGADEGLRAAGSAITGNDLFIKVSANKRTVHEQEPVLLTYKVYTLVDLTQLEGKMPDLTGFHTQEVQLPQQKSFHVEKVNGRNYRCVTWSQYVMYPQMTGKLEIPSITFKGIVVQQNRSVDPFEAFFNGGSGYVEVKRNIQAPGLTINVLPLPNKPAGFSGGVGKFNISAQLSQTEVKAGNPITLRVVIGGVGNLKLIKQPEISFPKEFDKYDPKVTDKTRLTANGVEGNMVYDFLVVPRNQGTYNIPAVTFTYYDTSLNAYKTLTTKPITVTVDKGDGKSTAENFESQRDNDIRTIKTGATELHREDSYFFGSPAYWVSLLLPLLAFLVLLIIFRHRALENADIVKMRGKKANKMARKRLKKASQLMFHGKSSEFFDEVLRALWGYVSYKLNIPVEQLSRENIAEKLSSHGVDDQTVQKFLSALDECEFERYAPGDPSGNMERTFNSAMTAITEIEDVMKGKKTMKNHKSYSRLFILVFCSMVLPTAAHAITKQNADEAYRRGNYQQAIADYKELLHGGVSADLYYNLGNAYYRSDSLTQAILAYERAGQLSPGDDDIRFNLQFARSKTIDKITPEGEMFFVTWFRSVVNLTNVDTWATLGIIAIVLVLLLMLTYLFAPQLFVRKVGFFGSLAFLVLFVCANVFAWVQLASLKREAGAIVTTPIVNVRKQPAVSGQEAFVLHEGTRVDITDRSLPGWRGIRVADGREGWVSTKSLEEI